MTQEQLKDLDKYLKPDITYDLNDITNRRKLILFFYNIKSNWDNYQISKSICKVHITWDIIPNNQDNLDKIIGSNSNNTLRPVLAALYYNYIITVNPQGGLWEQIQNAFTIQNQFNLNAKRYFKGQCQCPNNKIDKDNYTKNIIKYKYNNNNLNYYYNQPVRYYGNR